MRKMIPFYLLLLGFSSCNETEEFSKPGGYGNEITPMYGVKSVEYSSKSIVPKDADDKLMNEDESR